MRRSARLDALAFVENLLDAGPTLLDARADGYGHGIAFVASTAALAGIDGLVVSDEADAAAAREAGFGGELLVGRLPVDRPVVDALRAYGLEPGRRPVLRLSGEVVAVKHVGADAGVSYGYTYRTSAPTTLALVGLGYADGVPRLASNRVLVRVGEGLHPLVGRVAMDQFVVDCGDDAPALGDEAVLFGDPDEGVPTAVDWAVATERTPPELTAGLGPRIRREEPDA